MVPTAGKKVSPSMRFVYLGTLSPSSALKSRASTAMMKEKSRAGARRSREHNSGNKGISVRQAILEEEEARNKWLKPRDGTQRIDLP
jgi:hypothetical protein